MKLTAERLDELEANNATRGPAPTYEECAELFRVYRMALELVALLERLKRTELEG